MNEVMTPTCITEGAIIVLPTRSEINNSAAPNAADAGIRNLLSDPMNSLTT